MGKPIDTRPKGLFGNWSQIQESISHKERFNGSVLDDDFYQDHLVKSGRNNKTSNKKVTIPGTSSKFISPSTYSRVVNTYQHLTQGYAEVRYKNKPSDDFWWKWDQHFYANEQVLGGYNEWPGSPHGVPSLNTNTVNRLEVETLLKLKDAKSEIGAALFEALKTYDMFASKAIVLYKFLIAIKKRNWKGARQALGLTGRQIVRTNWSRKAGGKYLEYIYGWKPLISDIYGTYELLKEQLKPAMLLYAKRSYIENQNWTEVPETDLSRGKIHTNVSQAKVTHKVFLAARLDDSFRRDVARAGLTNPLAIAWELVPYSFLIDWALPIGNVLEALDATTGLTFVGGYKSSFGEKTTVQSSTIRTSFYTSPTVRVEKQVPAQGIMFSAFLNRVRYTGFPGPKPYVKTPFNGSDSRAAAALALATQLFR
jgi:hypothetical protein